MSRWVPCLCVALALAPSVASADCAPMPLDREIRASDVIVTATVASVSGASVTFHVDAVYKGEVHPYLVVPMNRRRFYLSQEAVGQRYVVFLQQRPGEGLRVNDCGSSQSGPGLDRVVRAVVATGLSSRPPRPLPPPG